MDMITREIELSQINWPSKYKDKITAGLSSDSKITRKGLTPKDFQFSEGERAAIFVVTSANLDRDHELLVPKNVTFKNYEKAGKPVLWAHRYGDLSLGACQWIKYDPNTNSVLAKVKFGNHEFANTVYDHIKEFPLSCSIGFLPTKVVDPEDFASVDWKSLGVNPKELKNARRVFLEAEMLELSLCPVPSNPNSCQLLVSKGIISLDDIKNLGYSYEENKDEIQTTEKEFADGAGSNGEQEGEEIQKEVQREVVDETPVETEDFDFEIVEEKEIITKPETTENYHRIPVSDGHDDHKIRTITISSDKGIKALYCVDCKKIKTFLFDSDKFTMEEAQAWVDSHSKSFSDDIEKAFISADGSFGAAIGVEKACDDGYSNEAYDLMIKAPSECTCDEFQGDGDDCKGCGGKRKPKKEVEEDKKPSCDCGKPDCPICNPPEDEEEIEEDACKPKPKKSLDDIISEVMNGAEFSSEAFPKVEKGVRWNQSLSKVFDIASVPSKPASYTMAIYCQFLECKVKNIYRNDFFIWTPMIGSYLAGFKACTKNYKLKDTRSFSRYEQMEYPPTYEVVRINSKVQDDFLVQGSAFYDMNGEPVVMDFQPDMYGMYASIYTSRKNMEFNKNLMKSIHKWVETENPLKNEKMGLNGEFLDVDEKDDWDTIVLTPENLKASKYAAYLINEKGMDFNGRGMLLVGSPGTGKTKMARILMTQTKHTFIWVSSKDLTKTYYPEDKIALGFSLARQLSPCVLCLEDIDNWIDGKIVDMMKTELDGVKKNKGVITILTTNNPEKLPSALVDRPGRFHDVLNFDHPTKELRAEMLQRWAGDLSEETIKAIADATEGYSGAYMWELIEFAKDIAQEDELDMGDALVASLLKLSNQKDLIESIKNPQNKSVTTIEVDTAVLQKFVNNASEIQKSGRRLSSTSITTLRQALSIIEELISGSAKEDEVKPETEKTIRTVASTVKGANEDGEEGQPLENYEYLLHHIETMDDGSEEIHHCFVMDHICNLFIQSHLVVNDGEVELDGKKIDSGVFHVISGLEPTQDVSWSDDQALENSIRPKNVVAGMKFKKKAKVW